MISCCNSSSVQSDIADRIQPCKEHMKPILFVCTQFDSCSSNALLCTDCVDAHKGHEWKTVKHFFNKETMQILNPDDEIMKKSGKAEVGEILEEVAKFKARLQYRLIQLHSEIQTEFAKLAKTQTTPSEPLPPLDAITNTQMEAILRYLEQEKRKSWMEDLRGQIEDALQVVENNIMRMLDSMRDTIAGQNWAITSKADREKIFSSFIDKYRIDEVKKQKLAFRFSQVDKSEGATVSDTCTEASYSYEAILKPAVACTKIFTPAENRVGFRVEKLEKTLMLFEKSVVYVGACIVQIAINYKFRGLNQPSHGAYFIGSNGLSYHTKLPEYDRKNSSFEFGEGDLIQMWVNFKEGTLNFSKNKAKFSMSLGLNQRYMLKLTPCIMFSGEKGPKVRILNEDELGNLKK